MFKQSVDKTKMFFTQQIERCAEKINSLLTKPATFEDNSVLEGYDDGYWAFEMYTPEWINEHGETEKPVHTVLVEPHEGIWIEVLDRILDAMEAHYGYNIKEQVYYSVNFPLNNPKCVGYSRCLNDDLLQQLLLAHPEVYKSQMFGQPEKDIFA